MFNKYWFEAKNINCFKNGFRVIKDLNLNLAYTENVVLIGPNGSGKSTLIDMINSLQQISIKLANKRTITEIFCISTNLKFHHNLS